MRRSDLAKMIETLKERGINVTATEENGRIVLRQDGPTVTPEDGHPEAP
jgi:biotin operon repressor